MIPTISAMSAQFATTRWSQVLALQDGESQEGREALEALCNAYWYPLYAWARRRGNDPDAARDATQAFFSHLLETGLLQAADPNRGRFRSFLLTSFKNFLANERQRETALKRGGGTPPLSLDADDAETRFALEPAEDVTPDVLFERRWAMTLMERAMHSLGQRYEHDGLGERFRELKRYLTGSEEQIPYREVGDALGMSEANVRVAVHRLRKRYGEHLREEISQTVVDPAELDDELRHLLSVIESR
jgi:RNA polymerase sigma-70 factor (ECF subfamily)